MSTTPNQASTNPNQQTSPNQARPLPAELSMASIESLRAAQMQELNELRANGDDPDSFDYDAFTIDYLRQQGIDFTAPEHREIFDTLRAFSLDNVRDDEWVAGPLSDPNDPTSQPQQGGREHFEEYLRANNYDVGQLTDDDHEEEDTRTATSDEIEAAHEEALAENGNRDADTIEASPELIDARNELNNLRDQLGELLAKKQARAIRGVKGYDAIKARYDAQKIVVGRLEHQAWQLRNHGADQAASNAHVVEYILNEMTQLRTSADNVIQSWSVGKKLRNALSWASQAETLKGRIARGAVLGLGASAVFAAAGTLLVGTGLSAGVAAGAVAAGGRVLAYGRNYASADRKYGRGLRTAMEDADRTGAENVLNPHAAGAMTDERRLQLAGQHADTVLDADVRGERTKRRKSIGAGLFGVAIGAGAVEGINLVAYHFGHINLSDKLRDARGVIGRMNAGGGDRSASLTPNAQEKILTQGQLDAQRGIYPQLTPDTNAVLGTPVAGSEVLMGGRVNGYAGGRLNGILNSLDKTQLQGLSESLHITRGEGWYQTFKELGIPPAQRDDLLKLVGPRLVDEGIGYKAPELGGYGINMTPDGHMPPEVVGTILQTAHEHGIPTRFDAQLNAVDNLGDARNSVTGGGPSSNWVEGASTSSGPGGAHSYAYEHDSRVPQGLVQPIDTHDSRPPVGLAQNTMDSRDSRIPSGLVTPVDIRDSRVPSGLVQDASGLRDSRVPEGLMTQDGGAGREQIFAVQGGNVSTADLFRPGTPNWAKDPSTIAFTDFLKSHGIAERQWAPLLQQAGEELSRIDLGGGTRLAEYSPSTEGYYYREVSHLPVAAQDVLLAVAKKSHYALTA